MGERFGFLPASFESTAGGSIWLHAVSVGEIMAAFELLKRLKAEHPSVPIFVSTTTLAGREMAEQKLAALVDGVFFAPIDYASVVRRVLRTLRPALVVVMETEIWPNLFREAKRAGASLLLINGRISDRALPRYRQWRGFFRHILCWPDAILTQTEEDARRFVLAGAPIGRVRAAGNLKYDFEPPTAGIAFEVASFIDSLKPTHVWIAASTMAPAPEIGANEDNVDEDDAVIAAFQKIARPGLLLILVPRKPERFDVVAEKLRVAKIPFVRRTAFGALTLPGVLLLDSIGELAALYALADVVFMGGTLAARGGHNILEPAYFGKPVIAGPHMENFAEIGREFEQGGAIRRIRTANELADAVGALLQDPQTCFEIGGRGRELVRAKRGVTGRMGCEIWMAYAEGVVNPPVRSLAFLVLGPLTLLWRAGRIIDAAKSHALRRSLDRPVISIGGLTMGGVGKSPLVAHLSRRLREAGHNVAILTRGYRRSSHEPVVIVERGEHAPTALTGDEAQMFIRGGDAHVGIGKDRFAVGKKMELQLQPDVFILDDGFQHGKLARKHDIVLIDALNPFGGGVFPLGRSREPAEALRRATILMVTRSEPGIPIVGLEMLLRPYNTEAPIFRSWVKPLEWVNLSTGDARPAKDLGVKRVAAFCGLGNPRSFWKTLEGSGLQVVFHWAFDDHHAYRCDELKRLAQQAAAAGAEALVTTEKDMLNLFDDAASVVAPLKLYWLKIGVEIENEADFLRLLL
jgi:3-deoxy-D-manno-octulosonic-acid transferase